MDALIDGDVFAAPGVVSGQAGFVARLARNVAAGEKEVANGVHVGVSVTVLPAVSMASIVASGGNMAKLPNAVRIRVGRVDRGERRR